MRHSDLINYIDKNDLWIDTFMLAAVNDFNYTHNQSYGKIEGNNFVIRMFDNSKFSIPISLNEIDNQIKENYSEEHLLTIIQHNDNQRFIIDTNSPEDPINWIKYVVEDFINTIEFPNTDSFLTSINKAHEHIQETQIWKEKEALLNSNKTRS